MEWRLTCNVPPSYYVISTFLQLEVLSHASLGSELNNSLSGLHCLPLFLPPCFSSRSRSNPVRHPFNLNLGFVIALLLTETYLSTSGAPSTIDHALARAQGIICSLAAYFHWKFVLHVWKPKNAFICSPMYRTQFLNSYPHGYTSLEPSDSPLGKEGETRGPVSMLDGSGEECSSPSWRPRAPDSVPASWARYTPGSWVDPSNCFALCAFRSIHLYLRCLFLPLRLNNHAQGSLCSSSFFRF